MWASGHQLGFARGPRKPIKQVNTYYLNSSKYLLAYGEFDVKLTSEPSIQLDVTSLNDLRDCGMLFPTF